MVCESVPSVGEMYACVVATSTATASAALKFCLPSDPLEPAAVFDLSSALPPAAAFWAELPVTASPSATLPDAEQPWTLVNAVSVRLPYEQVTLLNLIVPLSVKPPVVTTVSVSLPELLIVCAPFAFVVASCVGLFAEPSLSLAPPGLDFASVGAALSVSAMIFRLVPCTGVGAVLSTNASELVIITITAIPAPEPAEEESAVDVTLVFTFDVSETAPAETIRLVPDSCVFPRASTNAATTEASFCSDFVHAPSSPLSWLGVLFEPSCSTNFVAAYFVPPSSTMSPLL